VFGSPNQYQLTLSSEGKRFIAKEILEKDINRKPSF
jgi:hypothetical protein